ncbi:unnamed protein product, partial [Nesidiocoris tenuis]
VKHCAARHSAGLFCGIQAARRNRSCGSQPIGDATATSEPGHRWLKPPAELDLIVERFEVALRAELFI